MNKLIAKRRSRLQWQLNARWGIGRIVLGEVLKSSHKNLVVRGVFRGEDVVIKKYHGLNSRRFVHRTKRQLSALESDMTDPKFRVNRIVAGSGLLGIVVVEFVQGVPLSDILERSTADEAKALFADLARWTAHAGQAEMQTGVFDVAFYEERIRLFQIDVSKSPEEAALVELAQVLLNTLETVKNTMLTSTIAHPDLTIENVMVAQNGAMVGIDIHARIRFAVCQLLVRPLVYRARRIAVDADTAEFGLQSGELDAVLSAGVVSHEEAKALIPFFIGLVFLIASVRARRRGKILPHEADRVQICLNDLKAGKGVH